LDSNGAAVNDAFSVDLARRDPKAFKAFQKGLIYVDQKGRRMSRDEFNALLKHYPVLAQSMVRVLSKRLDATNYATFRDLTEKNRQLQKAYDELKAAQEQLIEKERLERELKVVLEISMEDFHLNFNQATALTCLTPPTLQIE
jgi:CRP-like cAMP-binding protein